MLSNRFNLRPYIPTVLVNSKDQRDTNFLTKEYFLLGLLKWPQQNFIHRLLPIDFKVLLST